MPSIQQSQQVDRNQLEPVEASASASPSAPPPPSAYAMSPFMVCSVPASAAGYDLYIRQFYGTGVPQQRIMSPKQT